MCLRCNSAWKEWNSQVETRLGGIVPMHRLQHPPEGNESGLLSPIANRPYLQVVRNATQAAAATKPPAKKKKPSGAPGGNKDDGGPWIQCDRCSVWVKAHSDNIQDLSEYDDSNPNHLDYFCPDCRSKQGDSKRKSSRRKPPVRRES